MEKTSRRDWLKSSLALTAGLVVTPSLTEKLMASPVSRAEKLAWKGASFFAGGKVRLNSNENPYGPSEIARRAVIQLLSEGNRYPFNAMDELKTLLAVKEGVEPGYIHLGAGSGELLCQTGLAFGLEGGSVMSANPTFPFLMHYAELMQAVWQKVNVNEALEHDYEAMASAITTSTKLVVVCNPNNPTGTLVDPLKVKNFCEDVSKKTTVFSDEAYLEFLEPAQQRSMVELIKQGKNVVVSRTFSKSMAWRGFELGTLLLTRIL